MMDDLRLRSSSSRTFIQGEADRQQGAIDKILKPA